jgi:phage regulator Rha-like protein
MVDKRIVSMYYQEPRVSSKIISVWTESEHRSVYKLIREFYSDLEEFGSVILERKRGIQEKVEETVEDIKSRGEQIEYFLNEQQATLLISYMRNSKIVREFKIRLVKEFYYMRDSLYKVGKLQSSEEWLSIREKSKEYRAEETSAIKDFIEYAKKQGSTNANKYYISMTKMENAALFITADKYTNLRNVLSRKQLLRLSTADEIIAKSIREGIDRKLPYKDIYTLAKSSMLTYATLVGKTEVMALAIEEADNLLLNPSTNRKEKI